MDGGCTPPEARASLKATQETAAQWAVLQALGHPLCGEGGVTKMRICTDSQAVGTALLSGQEPRRKRPQDQG